MSSSQVTDCYGDLYLRLRRGLVFGCCLASTVLFPLVSFGLLLARNAIHLHLPRVGMGALNFLFFFSQIAFPYSRFFYQDSETYRQHPYFSDLTALLINTLQWSLIGLVFVWLARRLKLRYFISLAYLVIIVVTFGISVALGFLHAKFHLEGP